MTRAFPDEVARQHALNRYALSDDASGQTIERLAELITELLDVPSAQVNLIDDRWQHTRAAFNWAEADLPREEAFCAYTIQLPPGEAILEIPDARLDTRFLEYRAVTGPASLRYYAGTPLLTPDGHAIGTLCLLDKEPRAPLTVRQRSVLTQFAALVVSEMERCRAVAEVKLVFQAQLAHEARLNALMKHTSDLVVIRNREGQILDTNPSATAALGPQMMRPGTTSQGYLSDSEYRRARATDEEVMRTGDPLRGSFVVNISGRERHFDVTKFPFILPDGQIGGVTSVSQDITTHAELRQSLLDTNLTLVQQVTDQTQELHNMVHTDPLTGLGNRRAFELTLSDALVRALAAGSAVTLLVCDFDDFQDFNDAHGRTRGDDLLKGFAAAVRQTFRPGTGCFRTGGDDFVLLTESVDGSDLEAPLQAALRMAIHDDFPAFTVSSGIASFPLDTKGANELLRLAEQRMLRDKASRQVNTHLHSTLTTAAPLPSNIALQAIRSTLHLLTQEGELDQAAWQGLLEAAVLSIPGAECGSFTIRQGNDFVFRAQVGFSEALLDVRQSLQDAQTWHGEDTWVQGHARLLRGPDAIAARQRAAVQDEDQYRRYERYGAFLHLKANINVPVMVGGEVLGTLNLDNMRHSMAFADDALMLAEEFAVQAAALLIATRRRGSEMARQREMEVIIRTGAAFQKATTLEDMEETVRLVAQALFRNEHIAVLRFTEDTVTWSASTPERRALSASGAVLARSALLASPYPAVQNAPLASELFDLPAASLSVIPIRVGRDVFWGLAVAWVVEADFDPVEMQIIKLLAGRSAAELKRFLAEQENKARVAELQLLADLPRLAGALGNPAEVAWRCVSACRTFLGADYATYIQFGSSHNVSDGHAPQPFLDEVAVLSDELASRTLQGQPPLLRMATATYAARPTASPALVNSGVQGLVLAPVIEQERCVGYVAFLWFRSVPPLPAGAESLADRTAELIGRALERKTFIQELKGTHDGALLALGLSLELRDFETHGHTERVVALAAALGQRLDMSPNELEGLRQGAYLHDVGKLGVPDAVLLKPGKLDADEWTLMKSHASMGADMMERISTIHPIARGVIRHHHERWDGTGYPQGLTGEEIPLAARVFSLVDVYDALVSTRPYKKAWSAAEALMEIRKQAGAQFDPKLAETFIALMQSEGPLWSTPG